MKIKIKYLLIGIPILVAFIYLSGYYYGHRRGVQRFKPLSEFQANEIVRYMIKIDSITRFVSQKDQMIESQQEAIRRGDIERKYLKSLNISQASEITMMKMRIDTLLKNIKHSGQIVQIPSAQSTTINQVPRNALLLPFTFEKKDKWFTLAGAFDKDGVLDITESMELGIDIFSGINKQTKDRTVSVVTSNPYISVLKIESFKFDERPQKKNGIGVQIGYGVLLKEKPQLGLYVGVGVQRSMIRF